MKSFLENKIFHYLILSFIIFGSLFPTIRLLVIGSRTSQSAIQFIFSASPEIFACLILAFMSISFIYCKNKIIFKPIDWIVLAFTLSNTIIGFIIAQDIIVSIYGFRMTYFPVLFYFVFRFCKPDDTSKSLRMIFYWFLFIGIVGIILYFLFYDLMLKMILLGSEGAAEYFIVRMTSIFWSPVVFSTFMSVAFLFFYFLFLTKEKWIYLLFIVILVFCIIMAMSRGAMISSLVAFFLLSLLIRNWKNILYSFLAITAIYLLATYVIASPGEISSWMANSTMETVEMKKGVTRVDLWVNAFKNFSEHPMGYGLGKAGHVAARFYGKTSQEADVYSTDGWFLKLMNETGVMGLISYFIMAVIYLILFLKKKVFRSKTTLLLFFFTMFIMVNVQNLVSNVLDFYLFSFLFWAMMGASVKLLYEPLEI
jgi:hypothetical protein